MEHFLTKKAQPSWLIKFLEILLLLSLGLWTVAGVAVSIEQFSETVESVDVAVYAILISGPLLVVLWIIRRIWFRNRARKIAVTLAWESECVISWTQLNEHAHIRNSQALVMELYEKGYLTGIAPSFDILTLTNLDSTCAVTDMVLKCAMCGAVLHRNEDGSWICQYCRVTIRK